MSKIISFLRTSSLALLLAHFRQNFIGLHSSLRSVLLQSIRTLTLVLSFSFFLFLPLFLPVSQVSGQEPTPSPTDYDGEIITPHALFPSFTPEPTKDVTCPAGNPVGWGTTTPDAYWSLYCGNCVTQSVLSTETPYPVSTYMIPLTQTAQAICQTAVASGGVTSEACGSFPTATVTPTAFMTATAPVACGGSMPTVMPTNSAIPSSWLIVQETGLIYSGSWTLGACGSCSGGNEKYSNVVGDYFTYTANTTGFRFVQKIKDNYGVAKIYIDGDFITNVDLYSASLLYHQVVYEVTNLPYGSHTLKVEVSGEKNNSSSNYWIGVDYLQYQTLPPTPYVGGIACNDGAGNCVSDGTHATVTYTGSATAIGNYFSLSPAGVPLQVTVSVTMTHDESSGYSANRVYDGLSIVQSVQGAVFQDSQWCVGVVGTYSTCSASHTGVYTVTPNAGDARFYVGTTQAADYPSTSTMTYIIDVWIGVQCMTTPTPSVTSTPSSFCASVLPASSSASPISEFSLPVPVVGSTYCPVKFPGLELSLWHFGTLSIPKLSVCFQEITFGVLKYFDYEVEIDKLAFIFAAAKIVSIFIGSK